MTETRVARRPALRSATTEDVEFAALALDLPDQSAYLGFYGLKTVPFRASADPKHLWLGPRQQRVLDTMAAAIALGTGVVLLTGEMGTGKTSLVNGLADRLAGSGFAVARLPGVGLDPADVLVALAGALRVPGASHDRSTLVRALAEIAASGSSRRTIVLMIDEAQSLGALVLRELGELASAAAASGCPLCVVLVGQAELTWELADQRHAELRQHVTTRCALDPLSASEVAQYVRHCLELAGAAREIFRPDSIEAIASLSRGAPAAINSMCERALLTGYRRQLPVIGRDVIGEAAVSEHARPLPRPPIMQPAGRRARAASQPSRAAGTPGRSAQRVVCTTVAVGIAVIAAGGYSLHAGWLGRTRETPPAQMREQATAIAQVAAAGTGEPTAPAVNLASRTDTTAGTAPATAGSAAAGIAPPSAAAVRNAMPTPSTASLPSAVTIPGPRDPGTATTAGTAPPSTAPTTASAPSAAAAAITAAAPSVARPPSTTPGTGARVRPSIATAPSIAPTASAGSAVITTATRPRANDVGRRTAALPDIARRRSTRAPVDVAGPVLVMDQRPESDPRPSPSAARRRAASSESDGNDPGSVIDWLLKEHVPAHR